MKDASLSLSIYLSLSLSFSSYSTVLSLFHLPLRLWMGCWETFPFTVFFLFQMKTTVGGRILVSLEMPFFKSRNDGQGEECEEVV